MLSSNGIHSETCGTGDPVILLHGWGMHSGFWRDIVTPLASDFQVTRLDLPGHGNSAMLDEFQLDTIARQLVAVAPPGRVHWIGWSLGALVVLQLASMFPDRVASVVVVSGNPKFSRSDDWSNALDVSVLEQFYANLSDDFNGTLLRFLKFQTRNLPRGNLVFKIMKMVLNERREPDRTALAAGVDILINADLRECMSELVQPLMILLGGQDPLVPVEVGADIKRLNPSARVTVLHEAGHIPFVSHSVESLKAIQKFLLDV